MKLTHSSLLITLASTWTAFSYPEDGGSKFLRNIGRNLHDTWNFEKNHHHHRHHYCNLLVYLLTLKSSKCIVLKWLMHIALERMWKKAILL